MIPFLSVCSGIGAPEVAFAPAGMHSVLASEIEEFPRAVLRHRFGAWDAATGSYPLPNPPPQAGEGERGPALWGDFTALRVRHMRRLGIALPRVLVGGTPCQSFSVAGKRGSLSDPRGNLSLAYVRLAHALADALANAERTALDDAPVFYAVWENVPGVLSTGDNAFGCLLGAIVGGDAAFDLPRGVDRWPDAGMVAGPRARAAWRILDAQHFRVPQRRRRVILVVGFGAGADPAEVLLEPESLWGDPEAGTGAAEDLAGTLAGGARSGGGHSLDDVPMTAEAGGGGNTSGPIDVAACLTAKGQRIDFEVETFVAELAGTLPAGGNETGGDRQPGISVDTADTYLIAHSLRAQQQSAHDATKETYIAHAPHREGFGVRRLMPRECERLQSFPDDHTLIPWRGRPAGECPDGPRYRALGNSMNVEKMAWLGARLAASIRRADG